MTGKHSAGYYGDYYARNREALKAYARAWYAAHKSETAVRNKSYRLKNRDRLRANGRANKLWKLYGITLEQYSEILALQHGCCKICLTDSPGGTGSFHVDHCHDTGEVRGLLCSECNMGLGKFKDDPTLLLQAHDYLLQS